MPKYTSLKNSRKGNQGWNFAGRNKFVHYCSLVHADRNGRKFEEEFSIYLEDTYKLDLRIGITIKTEDCEGQETDFDEFQFLNSQGEYCPTNQVDTMANDLDLA